jgi:perosamine synthetase
MRAPSSPRAPQVPALSASAAPAPHTAPMPKAPVLSWTSLWPRPAADVPSVNQLPHRAALTSGRAALLAALKQLQLPAGSGVLVPTYHCPTMVAPILQAGLRPLYYPINERGLPLLDGIAAASTAQARVMFAAHYFGLPQSFQTVLDWCQARGIALVEDCAHSYFGRAGERPVGHWGDYATASLSKFFPVAEGGLLASATRPLRPLGLHPAGARAQLKGVVDVLEFAHRHRRLGGLSQVLTPFFWLKNGGSFAAPPAADAPPPGTSAQQMMQGCDMARVAHHPSVAARWIHRAVATRAIVQARRSHYQTLADGFVSAPGAHAFSPAMPEDAAPYVCPLWVEGPQRADEVYARMRRAGLAVFRWDQIWPGTPADPADAGPGWSRQMLQLLCHQDLSTDDVVRMVQTTQHLLAST